MKAWIALTLFAAASCGSGHVCSCPADGCDHCDPTSVGVGEVLLTPGLPAVASTFADSPCSTDYQPFANRVLVSHPGEGSCNAYVQFVDGSTYAEQFRFSKINGPCGCYLGVFASGLAPKDAGSD